MSFSALSARQRIESVVDPGTFEPLANDVASGGFVLGRAEIDRRPVLLAFSDGHVRGGTYGVREAERLSDLLDLGAHSPGQAPAVVLGFDTGGVRVEEGPVALAATSGAGVGLAELALAGVTTIALVSGPRGCFGAPSVMASLPQQTILTAGSYWGLTGPKLIESIRAADDDAALAATSAANRLHNGDAHAVVDDDIDAVRTALQAALKGAPPTSRSLSEAMADSAAILASMATRLRQGSAYISPSPRRPRRRGILDYSLRGQWRTIEPVRRIGMVQVGRGALADHPAIGIVVGPEAGAGDGLGIEEAALIARTLADAAKASGPPAMILTFLFCQGHTVDATQERFGLHRALAECLRTMVAARLRGHPIVSVLGGGTYGAAYFALAAPSHRILAMQGTSVAPMAPEVLRAFRELRGKEPEHVADEHLAEHIPDVRIVESVIRLPRVLREELTTLIGAS